jgi:hypothetical protein
MAEENPQASSDEDAAKAETIRITLPSKGEPLPQKRETVRINLPGRPAEVAGGAAPTSPKKETTKIATDPTAAPKPPSPPAAPSGLPKPSLPPPSGARPSAPPPPRPLSGGAPPKPPTLGAKPGAPTAPLKPAAPTAPLKPAPTAGLPKAPEAPGARPAAAPKKETARITLPPEGAKPGGMPKATVKMGTQTAPLRQPSTIQASPAVIAQAAPSMSPVSEGPDSGTTIMSIAAFVFALAALGLSFWVYSSSGVQ